MKSLRKNRGNTIAELPSFLYFLFFAVALPMMAVASMSLRGIFFLYACRDAVQQAAKCPSYTNNNTTIVPNTISATNLAQSVFTQDLKAWTGVTGTLNLQIIAKSVTGVAPPPPSSTSLATIDQTDYIYFIRGTGTGSIQPLFPIGGAWMGVVVPGLTGPFPLTIVAESYVENPQGLTN